jgi:UCH-binding domain
MPNVISEELINNTIAGFSGEAEAFWEGMQGSGIGREELMQMLASEMHPALRDTFLTRRDPSISIPQTPSVSQPPLFSQSSQQPRARSQQPLELPAGLQEQIASITAGLPGATPNAGARREYIALNDVLTRDVLARVLQMPGIGERLRPGMPENWDEEDSGVDEVVQSPQFQQVCSLDAQGSLY